MLEKRKQQNSVHTVTNVADIQNVGREKAPALLLFIHGKGED